MSYSRVSSRWIRAATLGLALALFSASGPAWAGELRFGSGTLEVDDEGKLTAAGKASADNKVESLDAEEEVWDVSVWAKVDKALPGPVYFEFYREHAGKRLSAHNHEYRDYGGEKYLSTSIQLASDMGFHFGDVLEVELVQVGDNDKKRVLAKAKLTLEKGAATASPASAAGGGEGGEGGEDGEEDEMSEQDEVDGLAGGEEDPGVGPAEPPPIEPGSKKGCHVSAHAPDPWALAMLLIVAGVRRRRVARAIRVR